MLKIKTEKLNNLINWVSRIIPDPKTNKQKVVFTIISLFLSSFLLSGTIFILADLVGYGNSGPTAAPNSLDYGLVGYWNFEEGGGQTVYDRSGNGNNGTLGASSAVGTDDPTFVSGHDSSGEVGTGIGTDGVNDYVDVGNGSSLDVTQVSFCSWFYSSGTTGAYQSIISKNNYYWLLLDPTRTTYYIQIKTPAGYITATPSFSKTSQWVNACVTFGGVSDPYLRLYENGVQIYTSAIRNENMQSTTASVAIGKSTYSSPYYFSGKIDEVRIYNRAITADEVQMLYNQKKPVLEINLDEGSGILAKDSSFNNYGGTVYGATGTAESGDATTLTDTNKSWTTNEWANETIYIVGGTGLGQNRTVASNTVNAVTVSSAWTTNPDATSVYAITSQDEWTSGKQGGAIDFDGTDDYVNLGDIFRPSKTEGRSFSFWVYPDSLVSETVFSTGNLYNNKAGFSEFVLTATSIDVSYDFNVSPYVYSFPITADVGQWNHFILAIDVSDSVNTVLNLYKNGKLVSSMTQQRVPSGGSNESFLLGARYSGATDGKANLFDGKIDKFKIYNYTLSDDEASVDYSDSLSAHLGKGAQDLDYGLVGHWNFEEGAGQTVYDKSGNDHNGTLGANSSIGSDDPVFVAGHDSIGDNGTGLKFDGVNDYVDAGSTGNLSAISISAWVYYDGLNTIWKGIVDQCRGFSSSGGFSLSVGDGSNPNKVILMLADGSAPSPHFTTTDDLPLNQWVHIIAVWDGTTSAGSMKIYFNSVRQSGTDGNFGTNLAAATLSTHIGGSNATFPGSIDEVRLYDRVLSEDEILMLYNQKKPLLDLDMDEGSGVSLNDNSFNHYNGTIYGANGTAESGGATTLTDTNKSWTTDEWSGETISILYGTGIGQSRTVASNTATAITVSSAWTTNPDTTSVYQITSKDEWGEGKNKTAIDFDGVDDYADLGDVLDMGKNDMTISTWIKTSVTGSSQYLISKSKAASQNYRYAVGVQNSKLKLFLQGDDPGADVTLLGNANVADGLWHFASFMFDRDGNASIYVDGVYDNSTSISHWSDLEMNSNNPFRIGIYTNADNAGVSGVFSGSMDNVRVYNYIRTQEEILTDYNEGKSVKFGENNQDLNSGLVGYWNFEEGAGQTVYDSSGNGNNGTLGASSAVGADDPIFGTGYGSSGEGGAGIRMDGVDDYLLIPEGLSGISQSIQSTISFWFNKPSGSADVLLNKGSSGFYVLVAGSYVRYSVNSVNYDTTVTVPTNVFNNLTYSKNGSNLDVYLNGVFIERIAGVGNLPALSALTVGKYHVDGFHFDGSIDEVRIYNRAISDDEVRTLYNQKKPILEMKFDEGSGTVAYDESFNNNDGTITGATWTEGKFGNALSFDGTDDYVSVSDNNILDITTEITIGAWVKKSVLGDGIIAGKNNAYLLGFSSVDKVYYNHHNGTSWNGVTYSNQAITDNNWHYISATYSKGGGAVQIYVDGALDGGSSNNSTLAINTNPFTVGYIAGWTANWYFSGSIDEARVYNYARSADEIKTDYNNGLATHLR
jgi:hypothetical protein